jgi:hypothetical protein
MVAKYSGKERQISRAKEVSKMRGDASLDNHIQSGHNKNNMVGD